MPPGDLDDDDGGNSSNNGGTDDGALKLLQDRVEFRLYAAEQHLDRLKEIGDDISKDSARIEVEVEVDCFLSHLVGAVDSLLFEINDKLELGVRPNDVSFANVQSALNAKTKKISLLGELDEARQNGRWYALLEELKNQSVHETFLKKIEAADESSGGRPELRFMKVQRDSDGNAFEQTTIVMNVEVIAYLEKSLQQVRELICHIMAKEPQLFAR